MGKYFPSTVFFINSGTFIDTSTTENVEFENAFCDIFPALSLNIIKYSLRDTVTLEPDWWHWEVRN